MLPGIPWELLEFAFPAEATSYQLFYDSAMLKVKEAKDQYGDIGLECLSLKKLTIK